MILPPNLRTLTSLHPYPDDGGCKNLQHTNVAKKIIRPIFVPRMWVDPCTKVRN